ncbi:ATP-dependent helicase [Nonomuraea longicatena]|uniref:DNA 3'-5' helicase n=1 Tax=Nonomuraea longicatena TaxID=83682 RepID=A0ABP4AAC8_9ACTN
MTLTSEQRVVVEQPAGALTLVTAGAGAGKTYTLVSRLERLMEELNAGEILALTFSRSAVRELRERLLDQGGSVRHVHAQTFDSWALDLLTNVEADGDWYRRSFEGRIAAAQRAIERGLADDLFEDLRHVVVDEVQDLVGSRRDLVETLLERFDCGFTVVGDPAQSIYGFTVPKADERAGETNRFFDWLRVTFGEELTELSLSGNFRGQSQEARSALDFGPRLRANAEVGAAPGEPLYVELRDSLRSCLNLGRLDGFTADVLGDYNGTTAVLCRTNGQALIVSEALRRFGVPHRLRRSAQDRMTPAWVADLFHGTDGWSLSRERFDRVSIPDGYDRDKVWRCLQRTCDTRGRILDLSRLRTAIAAGRMPDELTDEPSCDLVISSFHRAKGLEFDRVVVVDPGPLDPARDAVDPSEEARLLYVAMTRPRHELEWLDALNTGGIRIDRGTGRWARYGYRHWVRSGLEVTGSDVHPGLPAGQEYLRDRVAAGDEVVLLRADGESATDEESPSYTVSHDGREIGVMSQGFRSDLHRLLRTSRSFRPRNWPKAVTGLHVDDLETVAGTEAAGSRAGLGPHGIWLAPRLMGLGTFVWDGKGQIYDPA